ncbi:MAG TPA: tetratricopeptide repeat protein [Anaerohalosphaeraceae bacterium]|nr:tetratricopeptide repeat protein [Anaerohalosphaeraceae bacterium]HOL89406.1 tetratricopeptide repeat protein [Anaerohalosphaeraceae bacterium]HPP55602.1 tetratricopeptide repeat protein [Anaerohalosphaeraceae bacterium]
MERNKWTILLLTLTGLCCLGGGCALSHAQKKEQMLKTWEKSSVGPNLAAVRELLDQERMEEAKKLLAKCVQAEPDHPEVNYLLARVHLAEGRLPAARVCLQKAVEQAPQMDEGWFALGMTALEQGETEFARECLQKAVDLKPLQVEYILTLSHLYIRQGQTEQARELIENSRRKLPYDADLLLTAADLAQRSGDVQQASVYYKEALWRQGDNPRVLEAVGLFYMDRRQWSQAAELFEKLYQVQTQADRRQVILHWLGYCSLQAGKYAAALRWYDQLSVLCREDPQVWLEMGQAALGADLPERALYCGQKALQLQPGLTDAEVVRACALYLKKNYAEAIPVFQKICLDSRWEAFGWWMSGLCYQRLGQNALARSAFEKAHQLNPDSPLIRLFTEPEKKTM